MRKILNVTAHAGCDGTPDDSLESVEAGIRFGADVVELDVRVDRRGMPVLSHNFEEGREYRGFPGLEDALRLAAGNPLTGINCDVKEPEVIPLILDLAGQAGIGSERLILTGSVGPEDLEKNPAILKRASPWLNIEEVIKYFYRSGYPALGPCRDLISPESSGDDILAAFAPHYSSLADAVIGAYRGWGVKAVNMPDSEYLAAFIPRLREGGIGASVWTVNRAEDLKRLFALGVTSVTTRNVRLAAEVRAAFL